MDQRKCNVKFFFTLGFAFAKHLQKVSNDHYVKMVVYLSTGQNHDLAAKLRNARIGPPPNATMM